MLRHNFINGLIIFFINFSSTLDQLSSFFSDDGQTSTAQELFFIFTRSYKIHNFNTPNTLQRSHIYTLVYELTSIILVYYFVILIFNRHLFFLYISTYFVFFDTNNEHSVLPSHKYT